MQNKFFIFSLFFILIGCSSDKEIDLADYVNVFEGNNNLSIVDKSKKSDAKIDKVKDLKNIFNAKSYNKVNSFINLPLEKIWQINTDQFISDENPFLPEPIFIDSNLYLINNNGVLFKINSDNGNIIWKKTIFDDVENTIIGTSAISGSFTDNEEVTIYIHSGYNELIAVNGFDGNTIWTKTHDLPFRGGMTVSEGFLYISDYDGNFLSINSKDGKTNWNISLGSDYNSTYTNVRPIIAKNKIIVPVTGGSFFIILIETGEVDWTNNISSNKQLPKLFHTGDIVANPIYNNGVVYLVSQSGNMSAFDINTSQELWELSIGGLETPTLSGETIFISGNMGILAAIDINTGKVRWTKKYPSYINEDALFAEKEVAIYRGPVLVDAKILFADPDGKINIIDANNGVDIGSLSLDKLALAPIPVDNKVFFLTENGKLLAYK